MSIVLGDGTKIKKVLNANGEVIADMTGVKAETVTEKTFFCGKGSKLADCEITGASGGIGTYRTKGKNLFDKNNPDISNLVPFYENHTTYIAEYPKASVIIPVKPDTDYVLSKIINTGNVTSRVAGYSVYPVNGATPEFIDNVVETPSGGSKSIQKFRTTNNTHYLLCLLRTEDEQDGFALDLQSLMLEEGTEASEYAAFDGTDMGYEIPLFVDGKNTLINNVASGTYNGLTVTVNSDKSITVNGTASSTASIYLRTGGLDYIRETFQVIPNDIFVLSDNIANSPQSDKYALTYAYLPDLSDYVSPGAITKRLLGDAVLDNTNGEYKYLCVYIYVASGTVMNNVTFKPMLRLSNGIGTESLTLHSYSEDLSGNLFDKTNPDVVTLYPDTTTGVITNGTSSNSHSIVVQATPGKYIASMHNEYLSVQRNRFRIACCSRYPQAGDQCLYCYDGVLRNGDILNCPFVAPTGTTHIMLFLWSGNEYTTEVISNVISTKPIAIKAFPESRGSYEPYFQEEASIFADSALGTTDKISTNENDVNVPTTPSINCITAGTSVKPSKLKLYVNETGTRNCDKIMDNQGNVIDNLFKPMHKINYYSQDGNTLLYSELVEDGANGHSYAQTKAATAGATYEFVGWSATTNSTSANQSILENITTDKTVYAAFYEKVKTFTVTFYNESTWLQTVENVPYGGTATYTGSTPTKTDHTFIGWDPSPTNVTEDISCYAQFKVPYITDSWEVISQRSAAGTAQNYYSVGDCKPIELNGTMGTLALNTTLYVYILGFNHNSSYEGNGITFGCFKTAATNGVDVCLVDSHYNSYDSSGSKWFNMSHRGGYSYGGWKGCDMRYDILGSTDVQPSRYGSTPTTSKTGYDATSTCATSPVANTLMSCLPSDLRAVMKPMTKYTDNVGNKSNVEANVTSSIDYLPLLSEYEVQGARSYANQYEQNKQARYAYYAAGKSKVKYQHSATSSTASWWCRSAYYSYSYNFCIVNTIGNASSTDAGISRGVAPCFLV